jgi:2'-hydroxyisoflavone reductase
MSLESVYNLSMRTLVLGGTVFLSAAVAAEFISRGHDVTCIARGQSGVVPPGARLIVVNRASGQSAYAQAKGDWDVVVDVSWEPSFVQDALSALADRASHWTYVSSCSVYADQGSGALDETADVLSPLETGSPTSLETYGQSKVACENFCLTALNSRLHICRPGLIGGPGDPSDRFGYWPARFARYPDDDVIVPNDAEAPTQTIDVRDLADWIVTAAEAKIAGTMNAVGEQRTLGEVIAASQKVSGHKGNLVPVDEDWLLEHGVSGWAGPESLPLWIPRASGFDLFSRRSAARAIGNGLSLRPLQDTLEATLEFERRTGVRRERRAGLSQDNEYSLLTEWFTTRVAESRTREYRSI